MTQDGAMTSLKNNKDRFTNKKIRNKISGQEYFITSVEIERTDNTDNGYDVYCFGKCISDGKPAKVYVTDANVTHDIIA